MESACVLVVVVVGNVIVAGVVNDVLLSDESSLLARRPFTFPVKMTGIKVRSFPFDNAKSAAHKAV